MEEYIQQERVNDANSKVGQIVGIYVESDTNKYISIRENDNQIWVITGAGVILFHQL